MHSKHMARNLVILLPVRLIKDNKDQIKTREETVRQGNVLLSGQAWVVVPVDRVRGCQHAAARVERDVDAGLGNRDSLLFHHLVDRHPVFLPHFVELIDAHHTAVRQHHRSGLKPPLPGLLVP
eukprot:Rmarinus@m.17855